MALKHTKDSTFKMDSAAGTLTDYTAFVNSASVEGALAILDDTALSDTAMSGFPGLWSGKIPVNGFINSTTEAVLGPLLVTRTSMTKTCQFGSGLKFYYGEAYLADIKFSGASGELQTFSFTAQMDGSMTRTSVTQA